ncbi:MAG: hypothetical protein PHO67_05175 [Candidatus Omnitrophica bacterium]|nr:hypothetical protein [Candidatus Omnitrophota bacterium]
MKSKEFYEVLGYLASPKRNCKLDAEMHPKSQARFEQKYKRESGIAPTPDNRNYYILHVGADKWGVELRIYFDGKRSNVPKLIIGMIRSSSPREPREFRINDNTLLWKLIKHGFVLADGQVVARIRSRIPLKYRMQFEKGLLIP